MTAVVITVLSNNELRAEQNQIDRNHRIKQIPRYQTARLGPLLRFAFTTNGPSCKLHGDTSSQGPDAESHRLKPLSYTAHYPSHKGRVRKNISGSA